MTSEKVVLLVILAVDGMAAQTVSRICLAQTAGVGAGREGSSLGWVGGGVGSSCGLAGG